MSFTDEQIVWFSEIDRKQQGNSQKGNNYFNDSTHTDATN